jgi:hypothetical protein
LRDLWEVLEEITILPAPDALAKVAGMRDLLEQFWRQKDVINLLGLRPVSERPRTAITLEVRMRADIGEIRALRE